MDRQPPPIIWRPTPKQAEFLTASEDEVLFGGSAGGGKSDALVVDALGLGLPHQSIAQPEYRALILRRTYGELKEIADRTRALYPQVCPGAVFNQQESEWRFPSGARIELSYLGQESDQMRYQSRQFQYIAWEELAQWPTDTSYLYLMSRLRAPERLAIPCLVRATCNPDGPGARWIAKRFGILPSGESTALEVKLDGRTWHRRFIAARLDDNPHLAGTGYREQLLQLPEETQRALLGGRWDEAPVGGAIFGEVLAKSREEQRITKVPHDPVLLVDTAWDLGVGDATAIWFSQTVGREVRLIDFYEASGEGLDHYAHVLDRRRYQYGKHWAPHDIRVRELSSGRSRIEAAASLGIRFDIAPNIGLVPLHSDFDRLSRRWVQRGQEGTIDQDGDTPRYPCAA
jgi:Terminase large subunit, T4likevirus-type, N-terminal